MDLEHHLLAVQALNDYSSRDRRDIYLKDHVTIIQHSLDSLKSAQLRPRPTVTSRDLSHQTWYELLLSKTLILALMELLYSSNELEDWYIPLIRILVQIIQSYNENVAIATGGVVPDQLRCTFADVCDVFVLSRGRVLCQCILATKPLPLHVLKALAESNSHLTKSIIGLIIGTTSLHVHVHVAPNLQECSGLVDWSDLCEQIDGKIWQYTGHEIITCLSGLIDTATERDTFHQIVDKPTGRYTCTCIYV